MANEEAEAVNRFMAGEMSEEEFISYLPPGCKVGTKTETETRLVANEPVQKWAKNCRRLQECENADFNSDWQCGDWYRLS